MTDTLAIALTVLAVSAAIGGAVLLALLLRRQGTQPDAARDAERLAQLAEAMSAAQQQLAGRIAALAESSVAQQAELRRSVDERLDAVSKRIGDSLEQTTAKTAQTFGELATRLALIDQAQKNLSDLSAQVIGLQDILDNKQARGAFGEQILETLVRDALPESVYAFQETLGNGKRVDCLIRLPNPPGSIAVDAKFPLESYRAMADAPDDATRQTAARAFAADVQKHVADVAAKYIVPGETAESALLFLPSEAVFAELHSRFQPVIEAAHRRRVWIVSPTTMMATLTTVRAVLKDARMREQAGEIQKQVRMLLEDVVRLGKRVDALRTHFAQADKDIREIETSSAKIVRKGEQIEDAQIETGTPGIGGAPAAESGPERLSLS
ncbi:MAG TPA: DNA recombination protein RmuC [Candidatus Cybelea sp.]|nr:DNA recombination protein RmuC [Candidatus Cybelea sp.]